MTLPQEEGLYRMLMSIAIQEAHTRKLDLNLSGGASKFKRHRGGKPVIEYSAVYFKHLPLYRKVGFQIVRGLLNLVALQLLKIFKL